ncbi:hypothetical protein CBS147332_5833 [Penicillium roqueforti]|nr:hypothetical protein CBS147332_5833 [Penicillium roqueforti]KAI3114549.1 hypothetical protein CBS147331_4361 [Penicillium roqueforti]
MSEQLNPDLDLIVLNCTLATVEDVVQCDIGVKDEKIHSIVPQGSLAGSKAKKIIDAKGALVTPGGIDAHVHLQEPPLFGLGSTADNFESGTRAAIAGGTTTIVAFAPQRKHEDSVLATLACAHERAQDQCYSDYSFHLIISNPCAKTLAEFPAFRDLGISSVKIYMTYEALRLNDEQFLDVLFQSRLHKVTTMVHAENDSVIAWMTKKLHERQLYAPKYHTASHPAVAEIEASYRAICLSEFIDTPILIVHVSNPRAVDNIRQAQAKGLPIYAETCPQYLFLSSENLDRPGLEGAKCVCSPPLRNKSDHEAIWAGLEDGTFTILSSDHSPFNFNDSTSGKGSSVTAERPDGQFHLIPNGFSGVETRMPLVLSADRLNIQKYVELTSTNPAKLYGMYPRKGALIPEVSDADFVIWYPEGSLEMTVTNDILHHNVDYTPFEGHKVKQWPRYTVLRGHIVWDREDGGVVGSRGFGQFLHRTESMMAGSRSEGSWDVETAWV